MFVKLIYIDEIEVQFPISEA